MRLIEEDTFTSYGNIAYMSPLYFNTGTGELKDVHENDPSLVVPTQPWQLLTELLVSGTFEYKAADFRPTPLRNWDDNHVRQLGSLVARDLSELENPQGLTKDIVDHLYNLGVFPNQSYFWRRNGRYEGLVDFRKQIGADELYQVAHMKRNEEYKGLGIDEFVELILMRYNELRESSERKKFDGPLTTTLLESLNHMNLAPGLKYIRQHFGGIRQLNDYLGFPDIPSWDDYDYIVYGASFIRYNGEDALTVTNIDKLSSLQLGPQMTGIRERFGWSRFKNLAYEEYRSQMLVEQSHNEAVEHYYHENVSTDNEASLEEMARHRALWLLIGHYHSGSTSHIPDRPSQFVVGRVIGAIEKQTNVCRAEIETTAIILNVSADLWPVIPYLRPPILTSERIRRDENNGS